MINSIKNWFWRSETILWARIQYIAGLVAAVLIASFSNYDFTQLASLDLASAFKTLIYMTLTGAMTEWLRRRNTTKETVIVQKVEDGKLTEQPVSYLQSPPPGP